MSDREISVTPNHSMNQLLLTLTTTWNESEEAQIKVMLAQAWELGFGAAIAGWNSRQLNVRNPFKDYPPSRKPEPEQS